MRRAARRGGGARRPATGANHRCTGFLPFTVIGPEAPGGPCVLRGGEVATHLAHNQATRGFDSRPRKVQLGEARTAGRIGNWRGPSPSLAYLGSRHPAGHAH